MTHKNRFYSHTRSYVFNFTLKKGKPFRSHVRGSFSGILQTSSKFTCKFFSIPCT